jgi:oleate hydratase
LEWISAFDILLPTLILQKATELRLPPCITKENGKPGVLLNEGDICIVTNGCMTDCATLGSYQEAAKWAPENPVSGTLWRNIAAKKEGLGIPNPFRQAGRSNWQSFTVTCQGNKF